MPQVVTILGPTRLSEIVARAGGLTDEAGDEAVITRGQLAARPASPEGGQTTETDRAAPEQSETVEIRKLIETGDSKADALLYPGDRVTVKRAELVYVLGAVMHPGGYTFKNAQEELTVLKALAMAGDVTTNADKSKVLLLRKNASAPGEKREEILVNYKALVKGRELDRKLLADDIVYVPESSGLKAMRQAIATSVATGAGITSGLIIYRR